MRATTLMVLGGLLGLFVAGGASASEPCQDTLSSALCMVNDFVWGPTGVVKYAQTTAGWARDTVQELLPLIHIPLGGLR